LETTKQLTPEQVRGFMEDGYLLVEGLFASEEIRTLVDNFMQMHSGGPIPGCFEPDDPEEAEVTMEGEEVRIEESTGGGPCGTEDAGVH
jgi:hypothetical protein